jgi:cell wall-associated NlpC family hydrolase
MLSFTGNSRLLASLGSKPYLCAGSQSGVSMKNWMFLISFAWLLSSCSALKSSFQSGHVQKTEAVTQTPEFIQGIEIQPVVAPVKTRSSQSGKTAVQDFAKSISEFSGSLESFGINQFKYAFHLDVPVEMLSNRYLYDFIDDWWKTPYRLGGTTKKGIDCSAFVQGLMLSVFGFSLPRTAREQKDATTRLPDAELKEGDLVFFNTGRGVSHVGVYLHNNRFVHASTSGGVMISSLAEAYWSRRYLGGGRLLQSIRP